jgi:hypothetical protein
MKLKQVLGLLFLVVLVIAISGCQKQTAPSAPVAPVQQPETPSAPSAPTAPETKPAETTPSGTQTLENVKEVSEGYCGDNICQNVEKQYADSKVECVFQDCTIAGHYTEDNYNCPGDCGATCGPTTTIGIKAGTCKMLPTGDIQVTIVNSGYNKIDGFLFYVAEMPIGVNGQVGFDTSEKGLDTKQATTNIEYNVLLRTSGEYTIDVAKWKEKFGKVDHVEIMPRVLVDGQTKECANQKVLLPLSSCK